MWVVLGCKWGEVCVKSYNMIKAKVRIMVCCGRRSVIVCGQGGGLSIWISESCFAWRVDDASEASLGLVAGHGKLLARRNLHKY